MWNVNTAALEKLKNNMEIDDVIKGKGLYFYYMDAFSLNGSYKYRIYIIHMIRGTLLVIWLTVSFGYPLHRHVLS